jgi:hypothetical protein
MEHLDRYLKAVASCLPAPQRDDIIRELSENIHSQVEDKESELGRPLKETEVEAILKQHGHPLLVAARYREDQRSFTFGRQLVGPVLFPFYIKVLSFNLGLTSIVLLVIFTALFASGQTLTLSWIFTTFLYQMLIQFSIVTLIFTAMDRHLAKYPDRWDPRKPQQISYPKMAVAEDGQRVPRMESASQLVALTIAIVWLRAIRHSSFLILGPAAAFLQLAPVWQQAYLPAVVLTLFGLAQAGINLVRPDWLRFRAIARAVLSAGTLAMWGFLLKAGTWIVPESSFANSAANASHVVQIANQCFFYGLVLAVAITAFQLFRDVRRIVRGTPVNPRTATVA